MPGSSATKLKRLVVDAKAALEKLNAATGSIAAVQLTDEEIQRGIDRLFAPGPTDEIPEDSEPQGDDAGPGVVQSIWFDADSGSVAE